jgi:hypothetical protein
MTVFSKKKETPPMRANRKLRRLTNDHGGGRMTAFVGLSSEVAFAVVCVSVSER